MLTLVKVKRVLHRQGSNVLDVDSNLGLDASSYLLPSAALDDEETGKAMVVGIVCGYAFGSLCGGWVGLHCCEEEDGKEDGADVCKADVQPAAAPR